MKRRDREIYDDLLRDGQRLRVPMFAMDSAIQRSATTHLGCVHDGTGDSGLAMHRPGFRVTDAPPSDELQHAYDGYEHELTTAWRAGKQHIVPDPPKAATSDAMPVDDIDTAYRLYAEEISQAWKTLR